MERHEIAAAVLSDVKQAVMVDLRPLSHVSRAEDLLPVLVEDQKASIISGGLAKTGDDIALVVIEIDQTAVGLDRFALPQAVKPAAVGDAFGVV